MTTILDDVKKPVTDFAACSAPPKTDPLTERTSRSAELELSE